MAEADDPLAGLLGEGLAGRLERWAAEARVDEAVRRRVRERWLEQQAREEATLLGVLADLAQRGANLAFQMRTGQAQWGRVRVIGRDFVAVSAGEGLAGREGEVLLALAQVTAVRTRPGEAFASGDRPPSSRLTLAEVVTGLAAERERVVLSLAGGHDVVRGTVWWVGQDVVTVRVDDEAAPVAVYVPLSAIARVSLA
jgi:hypothetical protein